MRAAIVLVPLAACRTPADSVPPPDIPRGYRLLHAQDFTPVMAVDEAFTCSDPAAWRIRDCPEGSALELFRKSAYEPPVRSPLGIGLVRGLAFRDFVLEADLRQTGREYGHRDMCVFFGVQAPDRFYYVHLASRADPNAHNVFRVDGAPRESFARSTTAGIDWGEDRWHRVRVVRDATSGRIEVYFDDLTRPIMVAEDRRFQWGQVGFGSFDDTGMIRRIRVWGMEARAVANLVWPHR